MTLQYQVVRWGGEQFLSIPRTRNSDLDIAWDGYACDIPDVWTAYFASGDTKHFFVESYSDSHMFCRLDGTSRLGVFERPRKIQVE